MFQRRFFYAAIFLSSGGARASRPRSPPKTALSTAMPRPAAKITQSHYETLASWRQALRRFLQFSQEAARRAGIPPQQHQALLAIKGFPERDHVSVGELAERLVLLARKSTRLNSS